MGLFPSWVTPNIFSTAGMFFFCLFVNFCYFNFWILPLPFIFFLLYIYLQFANFCFAFRPCKIIHGIRSHCFYSKHVAFKEIEWRLVAWSQNDVSKRGWIPTCGLLLLWASTMKVWLCIWLVQPLNQSVQLFDKFLAVDWMITDRSMTSEQSDQLCCIKLRMISSCKF